MLLLLPQSAPAQIFADGFESGDTSAWSLAVGIEDCVGGLSPSTLLSGDLGAPPAGAFVEIACLEVVNDQAIERDGELAFSGIPLASAVAVEATDDLILVGPENRRVAAQFEVLSRWGGTVDDTTRPIRWLQVALPARVGPNTRTTYSLRKLASAPAVNDPYAVTVAVQGADYIVDTGVATFVLDPSNPALFDSISVDTDDDGVGRQLVYGHAAGAGPRLVFASGTVLDTNDAAQVQVDTGGFRLVETGPVKAVVMLRGHFSAAAGASLCVRNGLNYERFGYTLMATFVRGTRDVLLQYNVRNECSDGGTDGAWDDDAIAVEQASWELPFTSLGSTTSYFAGAGAVGSSAAGFSGLTVVEQRRGGGTPWQRRARVLLDGVEQESTESFDRPLVAVADGSLVVAGQMPWLRYREPQALVVDGKTLSLRVVSESLVVGEGKGLWNLAKVSLVPSGLVGGPVTSFLESLRDQGTRELERGLLVRAPLARLNASRIYASMGNDTPSLVKTAYLDVMTTLHDDTVSPNPIVGQWHRAKTFGSQVWPDVQTDPYGFDGNLDPYANNVAMNYWNPSGAELLEFLRAGDPKWVWEFALPQSRLQIFTAYLNVGDRTHSNRNGLAVDSGGAGEGHWHRNGGGSDDYTYDMGQDEAYVIRPNPVHRDRFAQAGLTVVDRYSIPRAAQGTRDPFVSSVDLTRQVVQHFELLADCAEFVPGQRGQDCHDRLQQILIELADDNLEPGHLCQGDIPSATNCFTPQQFMQNALMYPFLHRMLRNYGDPTGNIEKGLVGAARNFYQGILKEADGVTPIVAGDTWPSIQECTLDAAGDVQNCVPGLDSDNRMYMWGHNKPHSAALMLMGHELDSSLGLCNIVKGALDDPVLTGSWYGELMNDAGWVKGTGQMMQLAIFGVGLYDTCSDP